MYINYFINYDWQQHNKLLQINKYKNGYQLDGLALLSGVNNKEEETFHFGFIIRQ